LVLGIGFFVKYAIDQNWINEVARMFIGIAAGFVLIALGFWLRKKYVAFSSVLTGGGAAVWYFTFFIAYREYGIIDQTTTFILMIAVTAVTVAFSIWYNRRELAIIAIVGGFASPFMVSTGHGNYIVFFSYLFILNAGMLVLAFYKKWSEINIITYVFTILFYGSWLTTKVIFEKQDPLSGALIFGTLFYLLFFAMNIFSAFKSSMKFGVFDIIILTSNTFLYYTAGMAIFYQYSDIEYNGVFTAILAAFNLFFALALYRKINISQTFRFLITGFALTFISLIAPVQFHGNFITLFWAAEFVVLYWLAGRSSIPLLKIFSGSVLIIVLISLAANWLSYYGVFSDESLPLVFNKAFLTGIFVNTAILANIILLKFEKTPFAFPGIPTSVYRAILTGILATFLFLVFFIELNYQLPQYIEEFAIRRIIVFSFSIAYFYFLLLLTKKRTPAFLTYTFTGALFFVTLMYLFTSHQNNAIIRDYYLFFEKTSYWGFYYHYINVAFVIASLFLILNVLRQKLNFKWKPADAYLWYLCALLIFLATTELDHFAVITLFTTPQSIPEILRQNGKIGYPVLWGISALVIMIIGFKKRNTMLRIISLSVFGLILFKLFLFDIRDVPAGGKTAAFIILGIILLLVSFLYQKLKKLLFSDEENEENKKD
jgi:uncharacterized membrane protein